MVSPPPAPISNTTPQRVTITRPDDFHVHLRDGQMLQTIAPYTASSFARAIVMPNLKPPVRTLADAKAYRQRILTALPTDTPFTPLMTLYLTDDTTPEQIREAHDSGLVHAVKLYPAGATTNSAFGVTSFDKISAALEEMQRCGMVLCIHGETTHADVDIFDREAQFVNHTLPPLLQKFPTLKIVLEHVTTAEAVTLVKTQPASRIAATITAHHLLYSRQAIFADAKIHPHMFCLPVLKRQTHRAALLEAVAFDDAGQFFAGTDSAPHPRDAKICDSGCAGIFTAHAAVELYAEAFGGAGIMHRFEAFMSGNGARFYGLPKNQGSITLVKRPTKVPEFIDVPSTGPVVPLRAGESVEWSIENEPMLEQ